MSALPLSPSAAEQRRVLRLVRMTALAYLAFVIYGSLVPLDFRAVDMADAVERFRNIPFLDLGVGSRADWVANVLLFIPLSFLLAASIWPRGRGARILTTVAIALGCAALSVAIEFTQIFFPPRTVSQNDILAEALGGMLGLTAWWLWGQRSIAWLASWQRARGAASLAEKLLWLYLLLLFGYNVLPLDLTISLVEIYHKWSEGRLNLIPFASTPGEPVRFLYEIATDALLWVPVSLLLVLSGRATPRRAVLWTLAAAALLEALQLLVYSRVSDVTDLITAVPGAFAGVWLAGRLQPQALRAQAGTGVGNSRPRLIVAFIAGWCLLLAAVFWYPFNFSRDTDLVRRGIDAFFQVPFVAYYFGTELRAITEVFHKTGFFLPLGALLAWLRWSLGNHRRLGWVDALLLLLLLGPPLVIELGQVALPEKHAGSTDLALEWLGAVIGYLGLITLAQRWHAVPDRRPRADEPSVSMTGAHPFPPNTRSAPSYLRRGPEAKTGRPVPVPYVLAQAAILIGFWGAGFVPGMPYNVRELLTDRVFLLIGTMLFVVLNLGVLGTTVLGGWLTRNETKNHYWWPMVLIGAVVVAALGLLLAAPRESIYDIVGSPVLGWFWQSEALARLVALLMLPATLLTGAAAAWFALRAVHPTVFLRWLFPALLLTGLSHWLVVEAAATDNLTELMSNGGSVFATALMALALFLLFVSATFVSASFAHRESRGAAVAGTVLLAVCSYLLILVGTEHDIHKYGRSFSALQFLLSPDRDHYLEAGQIRLRYAALHLAVVFMIAVAAYPYWHYRARADR